MKIDPYALTYQDISDFKFFIKTKNKLVKEYRPNKFIDYFRMK